MGRAKGRRQRVEGGLLQEIGHGTTNYMGKTRRFEETRRGLTMHYSVGFASHV